LPTVDWILNENEEECFNLILTDDVDIGLQLLEPPHDDQLVSFEAAGGFELHSIFRKDPQQEEYRSGGYGALKRAFDAAWMAEFMEGMWFDEFSLSEGKRTASSLCAFNCIPSTNPDVYRYPPVPSEKRGLSEKQKSNYSIHLFL